MGDLDKAIWHLGKLVEQSHNGATATDPKTFHMAAALAEIASTLKTLAARVEQMSSERQDS